VQEVFVKFLGKPPDLDPSRKLRVLPGEGVLIYVIAKAEIQQAVLLGHQERGLPQEFLPLDPGV
jgi:hypothetical protein